MNFNHGSIGGSPPPGSSRSGSSPTSRIGFTSLNSTNPKNSVDAFFDLSTQRQQQQQQLTQDPLQQLQQQLQQQAQHEAQQRAAVVQAQVQQTAQQQQFILLLQQAQQNAQQKAQTLQLERQQSGPSSSTEQPVASHQFPSFANLKDLPGFSFWDMHSEGNHMNTPSFQDLTSTGIFADPGVNVTKTTNSAAGSTITTSKNTTPISNFNNNQAGNSFSALAIMGGIGANPVNLTSAALSRLTEHAAEQQQQQQLLSLEYANILRLLAASNTAAGQQQLTTDATNKELLQHHQQQKLTALQQAPVSEYIRARNIQEQHQQQQRAALSNELLQRLHASGNGVFFDQLPPLSSVASLTSLQQQRAVAQLQQTRQQQQQQQLPFDTSVNPFRGVSAATTRLTPLIVQPSNMHNTFHTGVLSSSGVGGVEATFGMNHPNTNAVGNFSGLLSSRGDLIKLTRYSGRADYTSLNATSITSAASARKNTGLNAMSPEFIPRVSTMPTLGGAGAVGGVRSSHEFRSKIYEVIEAFSANDAITKRSSFCNKYSAAFKKGYIFDAPWNPMYASGVRLPNGTLSSLAFDPFCDMLWTVRGLDGNDPNTINYNTNWSSTVNVVQSYTFEDIVNCSVELQPQTKENEKLDESVEIGSDGEGSDGMNGRKKDGFSAKQGTREDLYADLTKIINNTSIGIKWKEYSRFQCNTGGAARRVQIGFSGNAVNPLVTFTTHTGVLVATQGGCPLKTIDAVPLVSGSRVGCTMNDENGMFLTGEKPGLTYLNYEDVSTVMNLSLKIPEALGEFFQKPHNTVVSSLLPQARNDMQWLPVGLAGGAILLTDRSDGFKVIGHIPKSFPYSINQALRSFGEYYLMGASSMVGCTAVVKVFDIRNLSQPMTTIKNIEGPMGDFAVYQSPLAGCGASKVEMLLLTPQRYYILSPEKEIPLYCSPKTSNKIFESVAIYNNGKFAVLGVSDSFLPLFHNMDYYGCRSAESKLSSTQSAFHPVVSSAEASPTGNFPCHPDSLNSTQQENNDTKISSNNNENTCINNRLLSLNPILSTASFEGREITTVELATTINDAGVDATAAAHKAGEYLASVSLLSPLSQDGTQDELILNPFPAALRNEEKLVLPGIPQRGRALWSLALTDGKLPESEVGYPEEELFSNWPCHPYWIQKVEGKRKPINSILMKKVLKAKPLTNMYPNDLHLRWADLFFIDPKDQFNKLIPNPYPFNSLYALGKDPSLIAERVNPFLAHAKAQKRISMIRSGNPDIDTFIERIYFPLEEALQTCFVFGVNFDWSTWNKLPRHVIGLDNSFAEARLVAPIVQCLYLSGSPDFAFRRVILRHYCKRLNCVACEMNILFTNMLTAANTDELAPICQMTPLLTMLRNRPEFIEAEIFRPAEDSKGMINKFHQAHNILLHCLRNDYMTFNPETDMLPRFPMPKGFNHIFEWLFDTQETRKENFSFVYEFPPAVDTFVQGCHVALKELEYYESLPQVLVLQMNTELSPENKLSFKKFIEPYVYLLASKVVHVTEDSDDRGHFITLHRIDQESSTNMQSNAFGENIPVTANGQEMQSVVIHDYYVSDHPTEGPNDIGFIDRTIPKNLSHASVLAYYVRSDFKLPDFEYESDPPSTIRYPEFINAAPDMSPFVGPLIFKDPYADQITLPILTTNEFLPTQDLMVGSDGSEAGSGTSPASSAVAVVAHSVFSTDGNEALLEITGTAKGSGIDNEISAASLVIPRGVSPYGGDTSSAATTSFRPHGDDTVNSPSEVRGGFLVAIDAEYVIPSWGNSEGLDAMLANGAPRKNYMQLARVSTLLSSKRGDERYLFDDFVATNEEILSYVQPYSGIYEGDLDPMRSQYKLTCMKAVFLKLKALVDLGVKFVGHGLAQDFRVCNIKVPKHQILDTLDLYSDVTGGKKLSLKFLCRNLLNEAVQEGDHDSLEDARGSLRLYYKYQELKYKGILEDVMDSILSGGISSGFNKIFPTPRTLTPSTVHAAVAGARRVNEIAVVNATERSLSSVVASPISLPGFVSAATPRSPSENAWNTSPKKISAFGKSSGAASSSKAQTPASSLSNSEENRDDGVCAFSPFPAAPLKSVQSEQRPSQTATVLSIINVHLAMTSEPSSPVIQTKKEQGESTKNFNEAEVQKDDLHAIEADIGK